MSAQVIVRDLWKSYDRVDAARGVSFAIDAGEIFALLGPNGAGKTTTLECILGLRRPDRGEIQVCGIDARLRPRAMKQRIGAALQSTALQEKITPREALRLFGSFYDRPVNADILLERFGLERQAGAAFETLSGGQRQRLALALAFINEPELVILDEPTTGLDAGSRRELHEDIRTLQRDGRTVFLTTHYIEEAQELCDRVAIMHEGRIIADGTPRELIAASSAMPTVRIETVSPLPEGLFDGVEGIADLERGADEATFRAGDANRVVAGLMGRLDAAGVDLAELHVQKASLEDVFIDLTGSGWHEHPEAGRI